MPFYDYLCKPCDYRTEVFVTSWRNKPEVTKCEVCGGAATYVVAAVQFNMDWVDREGFDKGAGTRFSNRHQRREWCKINGVDHVGSDIEKPSKENLERMRALRQQREGRWSPENQERIRQAELTGAVRNKAAKDKLQKEG